MPTVTIDDRTVEVEAGTNLVEAAFKAGVQIPHYCYHPRLSVVGQCRMCLVKIEGMGKLQAGCSTQVMKDGMVVRTDLPEVKDAQKGMMEFLLINHPLDCPICDQAGECGLQDYAFKHGVAYSRFQFEDKRTYPGRERIPLGANVLLNMNRCIQCTRCIRFTEEIAGTAELGFFNRGARTEIGTFPGKQLDNQLATCVVDICPVGALTSTRFRFAERVFYLDKKPSLCTGCEVGCNVTIEHRRGAIRRYKPRFNPDVNDYWMCDYGRATFERYRDGGAPGGTGGQRRLSAPRLRRDARALGITTAGQRLRPDLSDTLPATPAAIAAAGERRAAAAAAAPQPVSWKEALDAVARHLRSRSSEGAVAFLGSGFLTTEEAYLFARLADVVDTPHRSVAVDLGPERRIPNLQGGVSGREAAPNRRGAELAGLGGAPGGAIGADSLLHGDGLPVATHAEKSGTFVNVEWRVQRFERAFPPPGQARPAVEALAELLARYDARWANLDEPAVFDLLAADLPAFARLSWHRLPATGAALDLPQARAFKEPRLSAPEDTAAGV